LVSDATRGLMDPDTSQLKDLGSHCLKDVSHPQQIFSWVTGASKRSGV
jgi:hypothetical protein